MADVWLIYAISHLPSGRIYVGETRLPLWKRWSRHLKEARRGVTMPLYEAIRQDGESAFVMEAVACASTKTDALATERAIITDRNALVPHGFNVHLSPLHQAHVARANAMVEVRARRAAAAKAAMERDPGSKAAFIAAGKDARSSPEFRAAAGVRLRDPVLQAKRKEAHQQAVLAGRVGRPRKHSTIRDGRQQSWV